MQRNDMFEFPTSEKKRNRNDYGMQCMYTIITNNLLNVYEYTPL